MKTKHSSMLRAARIAVGLKQIELAERAGVSVGTVNRLELHPGFRPAPDTAQKLAQALGREIGDLFPTPKR